MKRYISKITNRRTFGILLCVSALFVMLSMTACNKEEEMPQKASEQTTESTFAVVRATRAILAGELIAEDALELAPLRPEDVPFNSITSLEEVIGQYACVDVYAGDVFTRSKLIGQAKEKTEDEGVIEYTLIGEYASYVNGNDYTAAIRKAIEDNPNSTIYFPDGTYEISDTIVIYADSEKSVSLRLSNYATIKAVNWSEKTKPMIRMGVYTDGDDIENIGNVDQSARNVFVMGGVIDASGIASGIAIEGSEDITLANLTVNNSYIGVSLIDPGNTTHSTAADIENLHVVGNREKGSVGVLVASSLNTLTNMRLCDVQYGMKCIGNGSDNIFRSIHAIGTGIEGNDNAGFWDLSEGNQYDICYSDQFATGFLIDERARSIYNSCVCSWWSDENDCHIGFRATGKLNANISYSRVTHTHNVSTDAYLLVGADGGNGFVYYPIDQTVSDKYSSVLDKYCPTDILH